MKKWQYLQKNINKENKINLNHFGKNGWELVSMFGDTFYLKRCIDPSEKEYTCHRCSDRFLSDDIQMNTVCAGDGCVFCLGCK